MGVGSKIRGLIGYYFKKKNEKNVISVNIPQSKEELLKDKIAFIVGGTGGLGTAIAEAFIAAGAKVIISGTNEEKLQRSVKKLGNNAKGIRYILIVYLQCVFPLLQKLHNWLLLWLVICVIW